MRGLALATAGMCAIGVAAGLAVALTTGRGAPSARPDGAATPPPAGVARGGGVVPLHFEQNVGQAPADARFVVRGDGTSALLGQDEVRVGELALRFGAAAAPGVEGVERLSARIDYFVGNDPSGWLTDVPAFAEVLYRDVHPGVDLRFHGTQGALEHDFVVAPGANPDAIALSVSGAKEIRFDGDDLVLTSGAGALRLLAPVAYQEADGARTQVPARFVLDGGTIRFALGDYDRARELVIDPVLLYRTYLGGDGSDIGSALATDAQGNVYATGRSGSTQFPTPAGDLTGNDAYLVKIDPAATGVASLLYAAYVGGGGNDKGYGLAVDASGVAYVVGETDSVNLHTAGAFDEVAGGTDGFLVKIDPSQSGPAALRYATYVGGNGADSAWAVAVDPAGNAYVVGTTASALDFPLKNAADSTIGGTTDAYLFKLDTRIAGAAGHLYSTFVGGDGNDEGLGVAVDASGRAVVAGETPSATGFPTTNGFNTTLGGLSDAFLVQLDTAASGPGSITYGTYIGGGAAESAGAPESGGRVVLTPTGAALVVMNTASADFPTPNGFDTTLNGASDGFVVKIDPAVAGAGSLRWGSYVGGGGTESAEGVASDRAGNAFVTGRTDCADLAVTTGALQATRKAPSDAYLFKVAETSAGAPTVVYASYDGGATGGTVVPMPFARGLAVAVDPLGRAFVTGETFSVDIANAANGGNGFDPTCGSDADCNGGAQADGWITATAFRSDLAVTPTIPATAAVGQAIALGVQVANGGPDVATGVALTTTIPAGTTIGAVTTTQGTCSVNGQTVTCALGQLASAATATVSVPLTPTQAGAVSTTSSATAAEGDPNAANNTVAAATTVGGATPPSPPQPPGAETDTIAPKLSVAVASARLDAQGRVALRLGCPATEASGPCTGTVALASAAKLDVERILSAKRFVKLGSKKFTVAAGKRATVRITVPRTGRALVRARGALAAVATITVKDAKGNKTTATKRLTVKPPKPKPR